MTREVVVLLESATSVPFLKRICSASAADSTMEIRGWIENNAWVWHTSSRRKEIATTMHEGVNANMMPLCSGVCSPNTESSCKNVVKNFKHRERMATDVWIRS